MLMSAMALFDLLCGPDLFLDLSTSFRQSDRKPEAVSMFFFVFF